MRIAISMEFTFRMPTLQEQLDDNKTRLNALLAPASTEEPAQKLAAAEVLAAVTAELKKGDVSQERAEYLKSVMESLAKNNFEATSFTQLKILNDPDQIKPQTASVGSNTLQGLASATPQTHFASNLSQAMKASLLIQKLLVNKELIAKGAYSDKLDDLMSFFGLKQDDLKEEYDLRWKVGDLVCALQQAVKLETFVAKEAAKSVQEPTIEKAASDKHLAPTAWPADMASAKFDPVAKAYESGELLFGTDRRAR